MFYNESGLGNTALGADALLDNTTGDYNIGIGHSAGRYQDTGSNNIYIGFIVGAASAIGLALLFFVRKIIRQ